MNARLALSTATPSIGGSAPTLETCKLTLIPNIYPKGRSGSFKLVTLSIEIYFLFHNVDTSVLYVKYIKMSKVPNGLT